MEHEKKERSSFSGGIGFVLAAAGSAVGLGNLWRFPYLAAQYGGGIFILVYIILALTFGFTLMSTEIAIGRKTKQSPGLAYRTLHKRFGFLGGLAALVPIIILPYYCVIGGWVIKYMVTYATGSGPAAAGRPQSATGPKCQNTPGRRGLGSSKDIRPARARRTHPARLQYSAGRPPRRRRARRS